MPEEIARYCPVCLEYLAYWGDPGEMIQANCPRCGEFSFSGTAKACLEQEYDQVEGDKKRLGPKGSRKRANASAWIREKTGTRIYSNDVSNLASISNPAPLEKVDRLLLALRAASQDLVGIRINLNTPDWHARAWALDRREIRGIAKILEEKGLIRRGKSAMESDGHEPVELTAAGWEHTIKTDQGNEGTSNPPDGGSLEELVKAGESSRVEFKSTMRQNLHTNRIDKAIELETLKTIAGFLNTNGGTLILGVQDDGSAVGLGPDSFENEDKAQLHLINLMRARLGKQHIPHVDPRFEDLGSHRVLVIRCSPGVSDAWVSENQKSERFFIRTGNSTNELSPADAVNYIRKRFDQ